MNTRNSYGRYPTRYNQTGTFVPAVTTNIQPVQTTYSQQQNNKVPQQQQQQQQDNWNKEASDNSYMVQDQQQLVNELIKNESGDNDNVDMNIDGDESGENGGRRPKWAKKGFKLSMRERRRRQNKQLRKLLTPKNALTVLNELTPGAQHECTVMQEQDQYGGNLNKQYVAVLNVGGVEYRGTGLSKLLAKNNAAEQVIRDVMIKQMANLPEVTGQAEEVKMDVTEPEPTQEKPFFPMIQLASYALHKLFSDWQHEGYKVPNLGTAKSGNSISDKESVSSVSTPKPPKKARKPPTLPPNAVHLHPSMLLSQMRNDATYVFLAEEGLKPNSQIFTMGVTVDGTTYVGKAQNKKEARRLAAKKACEALFEIVYPDDGKVAIEDM